MKDPLRTPHSRPTNTDAGLSRWALLAVAAAVAVFLMVCYVQLLNDSVARGAHWRYSQNSLPPPAPATPAVRAQLVGTSR